MVFIFGGYSIDLGSLAGKTRLYGTPVSISQSVRRPRSMPVVDWLHLVPYSPQTVQTCVPVTSLNLRYPDRASGLEVSLLDANLNLSFPLNIDS